MLVRTLLAVGTVVMSLLATPAVYAVPGSAPSATLPAAPVPTAAPPLIMPGSRAVSARTTTEPSITAAQAAIAPSVTTVGVPLSVGGSTPSPVADAAILAHWQALGGDAVMGAQLPTSYLFENGKVQLFANGSIAYHPSTGAVAVLGRMQEFWTATGMVVGPLGWPQHRERTVEDRAGMQTFTLGTLWRTPAGSMQVTNGAIDAWYLAIGGQSGPLGWPTDHARAIPGGASQPFTNGVILWRPGSLPVDVVGAIHRYWLAAGGLTGPLGWPVATPRYVAGGSYQVFAGGSVWASPQGIVVTTGAIDARYRTIGGPTSAIGWPTGPQSSADGGLVQPFTNGTIASRGDTGTWEVSGDINRQWLAAAGTSGWYGFPVGAPYEYFGGVRQNFVGGSLLFGAAPVLDPVRRGVTAADVWATWRPGCPVGPERLVLMNLNYWGFDNQVHRGEIIVRNDMADAVERAFAAALNARFPIRQMWREDHWGGDNVAVMAADNTSGFNCRQVVGGVGLSPHAYGIAIDINTRENPYYAGQWYPSNEYANRSVVRPGMLFSNSPVVVSLKASGWMWGDTITDWQHFQYVG